MKSRLAVWSSPIVFRVSSTTTRHTHRMTIGPATLKRHRLSRRHTSRSTSVLTPLKTLQLRLRSPGLRAVLNLAHSRATVSWPIIQRHRTESIKTSLPGQGWDQPPWNSATRKKTYLDAGCCLLWTPCVPTRRTNHTVRSSVMMCYKVVRHIAASLRPVKSHWRRSRHQTWRRSRRRLVMGGGRIGFRPPRLDRARWVKASLHCRRLVILRRRQVCVTTWRRRNAAAITRHRRLRDWSFQTHGLKVTVSQTEQRLLLPWKFRIERTRDGFAAEFRRKLLERLVCRAVAGSLTRLGSADTCWPGDHLNSLVMIRFTTVHHACQVNIDRVMFAQSWPDTARHSAG